MAIRPVREISHKVPPHNIEAEQSVLGGILLEKDSINKVLELLAPDGADFYHDAHAKLFKGMVKLSENNVPIDIVTLTLPSLLIAIGNAYATHVVARHQEEVARVARRATADRRSSHPSAASPI